MPTYDYVCRDCQEHFSQREHIAEHGSTPVSCPKCKSKNVERELAAAYPKTVRKS